MAPNEYAFISDETKGNINVYVGPHKTSLANTDRPVAFNPETKRFEHNVLDRAIQTLAIAPEGWYLVLKNPAMDTSHPKTGALNNLPELNIGRKVNIPGPAAFALWPGQMINVVQGHHLRSNQYLVVRIYDEEAAKANWEKTVMTPQTAEPQESTDTAGSGADGAETADQREEGILSPDLSTSELTMGKQLIIRGSEVSFYIPPTGVEVVPSENARHIRDAVTLERLEYCILRDEDGNKRYIQGPDLVFPKPTEGFVEKNGRRKFRAIELNELNGLYLKVIAPYEEAGKGYKVGEELFITGKEQMIYFPRPEHAIIKYGETQKHHAVAIPAGEARYVLNRQGGEITLHKGPSVFLPDPRTQVVVRRVLDPKTAALWFPGNRAAVEYNRMLSEASGGPTQVVADQDVKERRRAKRSRSEAAAPRPEAQASNQFAGDDFVRNQNFTGPRTITIDSKYEGAISIDVWTGYAIQVVSKTGERKVVRGPHTRILEYDETLQVLELSTGRPKSDENVIKTVYLRVLNNKVSDVVEAETADLCRVQVHLKYRLNFEGEPSRWFDVENYVKFLTDHLRSLIRNRVKRLGIQEFYGSSADIVRDTVLGPGEEGGRKGRLFEENGMRIYDVEVLDVRINDDTIAALLIDAQHATVQQALAIAAETRKLEFTEQKEAISQKINQVQSHTRQASIKQRAEELEESLKLQLAEIAARAEAKAKEQSAELNAQQGIDSIHASELARQRSTSELDLEVKRRELETRLEALRGEVQAVAEKAKAVSPDLIAALQAFGDRALAEKMAQSMAPLAILGGESVAEVLARLLRGTPLARLLEAPQPKDDGPQTPGSMGPKP